jgi:hypothetical protein
MSLPTVDQYGAPSYGPIGRPPAGIVFHTPENLDNTLTQAINTAKWQATLANTSGGSYHGILGWDAFRGGMDNPEAWVMVRSVPWDQAAGGISSQRTNPPWAPDRYPWMRALLPAEAFRDPNRWMHQISIGGKAGWYEQNGYPSGLVTQVARWVKTLEEAYGYDAILTLHRFWQVDRTDPGPENFTDLVLTEYGRLFPTEPVPEPDPVPEPTPEPVQRFTDVPRSHPFYADIEWMARRGITSGFPDGTFRPDETVNRGTLAAFLHRALGD